MGLKTYCQEGYYLDKKSGERVNIAIQHSEAKELFNFVKDGELIASVFREYKAHYKVEINVYGDQKIFDRYQDALLSTKFLKTYLTKKEESLSPFGIRVYCEETTVNPKKQYKETDIIPDEIIQKYMTTDNHKTDFYIETKGFIVDIKATEYNYKKKIAPLPNIDYKKVETISSKESVILSNIRSLSQISQDKDKELGYKDLSWLDAKSYHVVQTEDEFMKIVHLLTFFKNPIAVDTETTGLKINRLPLDHPDRDNLVGICISWKEDEGYYIPTRHKRFLNIPEHKVIENLRFILERKHIVTHYGIYDWKVFWGYGINMNIVDDTYILQYLIHVKQAKASKKLKDMTKYYFKCYQIELDDFFPKKGRRKQRISFDMLPFEAVEAYGPADADFTLKLYNLLRPQLPASMEYIYGQEIMLLRNIAYTEYYGIRIDTKALEEDTNKSVVHADNLEQQIYQTVCDELKIPHNKNERFILPKEYKAKKGEQPDDLLRKGIGFNISSPKQLIYILYNKMGIKPVSFTKKNGEDTTTPSTGAKALKQYKQIKNPDGKLKYPIMELIMDYKKEKKLISAFFNKIKEDMLFLDIDKPPEERVMAFIFPKYNPAGAESGRIAGYSPNLQQTAGSIRRLFIADDADHYLIDCDYSQIEYRVMASISQEESLMKRFEDPEVDFHTYMASLLFGIPEEKVTHELRKQSKALNFGIPYGMGDWSLAVQIYGVATEKTVADAGAKKLAYLDSVPKLRDFFTRTKDFVMARGYVETHFKRMRIFPDVNSPIKRKVEAAKRQAGNTKIQGTAADIMKIAYNRVCYVLKKLGYMMQTTKDKNGFIVPKDPLYRVAGSIHDELLNVASKKLNPWQMINIMRECMEIKLKNFVPLYIGATVANNWAEGKDDRHELPILMIEKFQEEIKQGLHKEPLNDPEHDVYLDIYKYIDGLLYEQLAKVDKTFTRNSKEKININYAVNVVTEPQTVGLLTKYYGIKIKGDDKKFDLLATFKKAFTELFGEDRLYTNEAEASKKTFEYETFDEHKEFQDLIESDDEIIDSDLEDGEEDFYVDERALRSMTIKDKDLKVETTPFKTAVNSYMSYSRLLVIQGKCYIKVDGITKSALDNLHNLLQKLSTPIGSYKVYLEMNDTNYETDIVLPNVPRKEIINILNGGLPSSDKIPV